MGTGVGYDRRSYDVVPNRQRRYCSHGLSLYIWVSNAAALRKPGALQIQGGQWSSGEDAELRAEQHGRSEWDAAMQVDLFDGQQHQADRPADEERGERADNELWPSQPAEQQSQNERKLDVSIPHTAFPDEGQYEVEHEQNQRAQDSASKPYPLPRAQRGHGQQHYGGDQRGQEHHVEDEMVVQIDERYDYGHACERIQFRQRPRRVGTEQPARGHGQKSQSAERFDQRIACGDRLLAVPAFRAKHQPGDDRNVVIPCDLRFAFRTEAAFRIGDADVVWHAPNHRIQERSEDAADE